MKGVGLVLALVAAFATARAAQAECTAEIAALQAKLPQVADVKRREEARLLIEKASVDQQHGRTSLCEAALARASTLMK